VSATKSQQALTIFTPQTAKYNLCATSLLNCRNSGKNAMFTMVEYTVLEPGDFVIDYFSGIFQPNAQVVGNKNEKSKIIFYSISIKNLR
jgi:ApbE superfamily uncharacterized protein (UPF0280 family)